MPPEATNGHFPPEAVHPTNHGWADKDVPEATMREICAAILGRPAAKVKMHRSFVAQGGDSLLAIKLMARCRDAGYDVAIHDILQAKSITELHRCLAPSSVAVDKLEESNSHTTSPPESAISDYVLAQLRTITTDSQPGVDAVFPCSPIQKVFLTAYGIHPELYQCTAIIDIFAEPGCILNHSRLTAAWNTVVRRHPSLRTVFVESEDRPADFDQAVLKEVASLRELDDVDEMTAEDVASRKLIPFNPGAPLKATLLNRGEQSARLRVDLSHALVDGESLPVILHDLSTAYAGRDQEAPAIFYSDYVSYQTQFPRDDPIAYWSRYLHGAQPSVFPPSNDQASRADLQTERFRLDLGSGSLQDYCGKHNVTAANICQVAWALVLRSYTGSQDVCFSYVSSGRQAPLEGIESAVGAFVDTMVCRVDVSNEKSLGGTLAKVRQDFAEGLLHPCVLAMSHENGGELSRLRGNTIMSCLGKLPGCGGAAPGSGLSFELVDAVNPSEYDISLNVRISEDAFEVGLDFWESRITREAAQSASAGFRKTLSSIITDNAASLGEIDVVPPAHVEKIREWNKSIPARVEARIHDKVEENQHQHPGALAIQGWDGNLTYQDLNDLADKLAAHLVSLGVGPETKVPLCFEKSKWAVVSQLAIMKASGCVVPISPNQPRKRTELILEDIGATVILASSTHADRLAGLLPTVLIVDYDLISELPEADRPICTATPDSAAFVIYTSGSTGVPKGVVLPHASLCTSLHYLSTKFDLGSHTRMVQFSAYTFDISIQDIYTTLHRGGCLCIISEDDRLNNLGASMRMYGVTCAGLTSTVAGTVSPRDVPSLKTLVLLGEAVKPAVVAQWLPHVAVYNAYGPSECSIQASCRRLSPSCTALNIGYPLAGALWVVDATDYNRLVPVGSPGELLIEGPLLAREYLNNREKTDEVFIIDPAWASRYGFGTGRRFYRTGDLVRQCSDGSIVYIGRRDTQVKFRGMRLEVGEIEHHLIQHHSTVDAAIVLPIEGPCKDRLVAVITLHKHLSKPSPSTGIVPVTGDHLRAAMSDIGELEKHLAAQVPEHMVPTVWIPLAGALPQNESAKLDRKALKLWVEAMERETFSDLTAAGEKQGSTQPSTIIQKHIQNAWADVLRLPAEQLPIHDRSFLGLGGDSIGAMRVISAIREHGMCLAVRDVLQCRSISELAQMSGNRDEEVDGRAALESPPEAFALLGLDDAHREALRDAVVAKIGVQPDEIEDVYPCSPIQQGILMSQAKSPSEYQIQQILKVECSNSKGVSPDGIIQAWQTVVDRHPMLRSVFISCLFGEEDGSFCQAVLRGADSRAEHIQCEDSELESRLAVKTDPELGAHTGQPAHRLTIYSTPSGRVYCRLVLSHALVDASSLALIQRDLMDAYDKKLVSGTGPSYSAYISYLQRSSASDSLQYWAKKLAGAEPCHLPALTEGGLLPDTKLSREEHNRRTMDVEIAELGDVEGLQRFGESQGVTVANVMQLAWALVLSKYTGSSDVSFGYLANGRDAEVEGVDSMVGPLINILVTRIALDPDSDIQEALQKVQDGFFEGYNHQHTSLVDIWHALGLKGRGLFNTSLSYRHATPQALDNSSLSLELITGEDPTEYDVTVSVVTVPGQKVSVWMQYSSDFMCREAAAGLVDCFVLTVESFVKQPQGRLADVQMVTARDLLQVHEWNDEIPEQRTDECIHEIVSSQRCLRPDATAVCAWDGDLTYNELEDAADYLARHLVMELQVGLEFKIALCLDKSKWAVVAQLAVLKAGGVVVSINPKHPLQRLGVILKDTGVQVMITTPEHSSRFSDMIPQIVKIGSDVMQSPFVPTRIPTSFPLAKPENAAFIIYTSGSTGTPKGVVLTHSSLVTSFKAHGSVYGIGPDTRSIQFASYTFDASISDIWATICHGGCVCVISEEERMNSLEPAIQEYGGTLSQLTPTVASLLDLSKLPSLRTLVLGGEAVRPSMIEAFTKAPSVTVLNGYGPSECSIYTTCGRPLRSVKQAPVIGRPLVGSVWVVDDDGNSISPIGAIGELWIGGPLLAREYLNDKKKTDKSFVKDPPWARSLGLPSQRFYRTGDLVRQARSGDIVYVARRDTQAKIRGQRVETGEIEYQVKRCFHAARGVVASLLRPAGGDDRTVVSVAFELDNHFHLQAEVIDEPDALLLGVSGDLAVELRHLRTALSGALPPYMVPSVYVPVTRFPMTTSGKVDRRLLVRMLQNLTVEKLSQYSLSSGNEKVPPATKTEKKLQAIWAAVLKIPADEVGANDHFLHSGGDSFMAMRLVGRASSSGLPLRVSDVFNHPRLADMARAADQKEVALQPDEEAIPPFALWTKAKESSLGPTAAGLKPYGLAAVADDCGVPVDAVEDVYPCTPLQEGLMAITTQRPGAYVGRWVYRIPDAVDLGQFKDAWTQLVAMAPILRTRVLPGPISGALQVIVREEAIWSSDTDLHGYLRIDAELPMTYGSRLTNLAIVESDPSGERYFVLTLHHSLYDGFSFAKMFEVASRLYCSQGVRAAPPYTRFISHLKELDLNAAESFWRAQFPVEDLCASFPPLPTPSHQPQPTQIATCELRIGDLPGDLTPAIMLRAAWALTVSPHVGNSILFGTTLSGRAAPVQGILEILAPTITTVPLNIRIDKRQSLREYLDMVRRQSIDMMPFEHTGLQNIRRLIGRDVEPRHLFAVQSATERERHLEENPMGLELVEAPMRDFYSHALMVECTTDGSTVEVEARFDQHVLSTIQVRHLLGRFGYILDQLVGVHSREDRNGAESVRVGDIQLVSPEELMQLVHWNQAVPAAQEVLIHDLVRKNSVAQPDSPAVCSWDGELTYRELDLHSDALAQRLASLGVGPEVAVPVCLDKSRWVPVAQLAVLKAGGVVVPVRADPVQRLYGILEDTGAEVALITRHYAPQLEGKLSRILVIDDALFDDLEGIILERLDSRVRPDNAAFIIYTSGSTGTPKGVVLEHRSMATSLLSQALRLGLSTEIRAFQFSHFTFDASVHDMFATLLSGGCICLPSEEERVNDLAGAMRRMGVNYALLTPAVLGTLRPPDVPSMRTITVGGDAVRVEQVEPWFGHVRLLNAYGPAECSIMVSAGELIAGHATCIGRNLAAGLWVVDEADPHQLLPPGAKGELLVEGPLLARSYLNDAKKTSAAFLENPVWVTRYGLDPDGTTRRMYRTGDVVVQNDDGSFTYIGRKDSQVKIRGQRVEPAEIDHHIAKQGAVVDAVVLYPREGPARARLVGVLTFREFSTSRAATDEIKPLVMRQTSGALAQVSSVRDGLAEDVPEYMVPSEWLLLEAMPQNSSGKVDRKKLTKWLETMDESTFNNYRGSEVDALLSEKPETAREAQIRSVISDVIHLPADKVPLGKSFLSMGGDSITAMQVVSQCRIQGITVLVRDVLQSKSIRQLALKTSTDEKLEIDDGEEERYVEFELSPIQKLYFRNLAPDGLCVQDEARFNQSVCLSAHARVTTGHVIQVMKALVERHCMLRARFYDTKHGIKQRIVEDTEEAFRFGIHEVDDFSAAGDIIARSQRGLDLQSGPVFSADWIQISALDKKLLFLTAHHLVVDLVSWRIIGRDLEALLQDANTPLSAVPISFRRWTRLQAHRAQTVGSPKAPSPIKSSNGDWKYWGITTEANTYGNRIGKQFILPENETSLLFSDVQPLRTEPVDTLIAGLLYSFQQTFTDRPAPAVFDEGHGRQVWSDAVDLSSTIGWFTTLSPIHVQAGVYDLVDVLARAKDVRRGAATQGIDYLSSRLLVSSGPEASGSDVIPEIALNYTGRFHQVEDESKLLHLDTTFEDSPRLSGLGANVKRLALFEIEASVREGRLHVSVNFNRRMQKQEDVCRWIGSYESSLKNLSRRLSSLPLTFTLSDFPSLDVTYEELSRLQTEILPRAGIADLHGVEDIYPCSPIQQGILLSQIKDRAAYQAQQICEIEPLRSPRVDLDHLSRAWKKVVARHAILRTVILQSVSAQDLFYQVVLRSLDVSVPRLHCSGPGDVASAFSLEGRPEYFDNESPNSMAICTTADGRTYVRIDFNHALMDASSLEIIFRDLVSAYDSILPEVAAPSYGLHISYLQRVPAATSLSYWTGRLQGARPCHLLPSTTPATKARSLKRIEAEVDTTDLRLQSFCSDHGVTAANVVQLAWGLVLSRYTGSKDVLFGYLANGRDAPIEQVEQIVGPMINMLVSHIRLPSSTKKMTAAEAAGEVQDDTMEALDNQRTSLGDIQHALHLSEQSLFNTTLSFTRNAADSLPEDASLRVRSVSGEDPTEYDINVTVVAGEDAMKLFLQYSTSFFDQTSAECVLESLKHALRSITRSGGSSPINDLEVISPSDISRIRGWTSNVPPAMEGRVADEVHAQAQTQPHAPAVCGWDGQLTYSELDIRTAQLARHLRRLGVGEGRMVGVFFEKSVWAIVAMLGVLRAGGVVVPLGFQHPAERLRLVLEDTEASVVLTSQLGSNALEGISTQHHPLILDPSSPIFAQTPDAAQLQPPAAVSAESAAVVIYTSGSTGRPKGVILTHSSLFTSLEAHGGRLGFGLSTRALQFAAYVFDISLLDTLGVLQFGGCVCVVSEEDRLDIGVLAAKMDSMKVNFACLTPTVASLLSPESIPSLRTLTLAGEQVSSAVVEAWLPYVQVYNGYGPAECTVLSTINGPIADRSQSSNIGSPVAGVGWVVDPENVSSLVPLGAVGELLLEGPIVSRGYLNDPDTTASSFIVDPPFISAPGLRSPRGRRMYRTGDLVRQSPADGSLIYIGRRDGQVKLRGLRIELGEIEHAVKKHFFAAHMVAAGVVKPRIHSQADSRLAVALAIRNNDTSGAEGSDPDSDFLPVTSSLHASLTQLQNTLSKVLPSFMIPSLYIPLREIPLTSSGKLDRLRLRRVLESLEEQQLSQYSLSEAHNHEELSETGSKLKVVWEEALRSTAALGMSSHFFRAGGDSVTAMRLVALARDLTPPLPLSISDIFQTPVLSDMAQSIDSKFGDNGITNSPADPVFSPFSMWPEATKPSDNELASLAAQCSLSPADITDVYPCTPLQGGLLAVTSRQAGAYVNRWIFRLDASIKAERLKDAWRQVFELVPIMRTRIADSATLGPVNVEAKVPMDFFTTSSDLETYLENDAAEPMGFGTSLMRFAIVEGPAGRFFVWTAHHSVYDGWTVGKVLQAVAKTYSGVTPPSFSPFTSFVSYVRESNSGPEVDQFWVSQLKGHTAPSFPDTSLLRHKHPPTYQSLSRNIPLPSPPDTFTLATLLRATWSLILSRETGAPDVSFPTPLSGRTAAVDGILDIMGPTITTVPVRVQVDRAKSVTEFLAAIQKQSVEMIPFEHAGLQNIRRAIPNASLEFNHLFVVQPSAENLGANGEILPGLTLVPQEAPDLHDYSLVLICNTIVAEGIDCGIELGARFDREVLPPRKIEALLEQFEHVLSQLQQAASSQNDTQFFPIGDLDLISPSDVRQLRAWNHSCPPPQLSATMHDLVHQKALKQPDATAVSSFDGDLSYSELDALAARLAHHLRDIGVRTETAVGVMFEKTKWAVVAKLATLKAGGTVVPLNHKHPRQRIEGIVEATHTNVLLSSRYFDLSRDLDGCQVTVVDQQLLDDIPDKDGPACDLVQPSSAAFILFTSGSTGKPKGVVLEHGSVASNLLELGTRCGSGTETRILQFSAYTFDLAIAEIFSTLFHGGCVCLVSEEDRMSDLPGAMEAARVNTAWLTPTVASLLTPREVPCVRSILFAGEALKFETLGRWIDAGVKLFNGYGPTEGSIATSVNGPITHTEDASNIGRALSGSNLWVVDSTDYHQLVPIGSVGELLVDGSVLAREYLGDSKKTADSFVTQPSWLSQLHIEAGTKRRFYRTGDLVRQTQSGTLEYIGRRDTQIKIHGQRVEAGEIEYWVKSKLSGAREAAVGMLTTQRGAVLAAAIEMTTEARAGDIQDMALLSMSDAKRTAFVNLQKKLGDVLPTYMVPQLYLPVSKLPLSQSGKLDRKAIWESLQQQSYLSSYLLAEDIKIRPSTDLERQLQSLWAETLNLPLQEVGASDDFFTLGGDSILAMRMVANARRSFALQSLTVADLFQHRALTVIAGVLDQKRTEQEDAFSETAYEPFSALEGPPSQSLRDSLTELLASEGVIVDAAPTTDFQAVSVNASLRPSRDLMAYVSLDGTGQCDVNRWRESCLKLIESHEIFRTAYVFHEDRLLQVILEEYRPDITHYAVEDQTIEAFTKDLIGRDMHNPPRLGRPFAEFVIATSSTESRHRILFRLSHGEYDAVAMSYFLETLRSAYERQPVPKRHSFCNYVANIARGDRENSHIFWKDLLQGSLMPQFNTQSHAQVPPSPALVHYASFEAKLRRTLPPGITPSNIIRAAWARVLSLHTGSRDVIFGEVVSGRNTGDPIAEGASGCCTNVVPVRVPFDDSWSALELLNHLRNQQISRLPHEVLGFREILQYCACASPERPFTSRINHLDAQPQKSLAIEGVAYEFSVFMTDKASDFSDVSVTSVSTPDSIRVSIGYLEGLISPQEAAGLFESLRGAVDQFLWEVCPTISNSGCI